jgi:META domain
VRSVLCCFFWFFIVSVQSYSAFAVAGTMDVSNLQGRWILESINGKAVESENEIYFEIDGAIITGFDGCNNFGGKLNAPASIRMNQRACISEGPRLPLELPDARSQLKAAEVSGKKLKLKLPDRKGEASFRRQ